MRPPTNTWVRGCAARWRDSSSRALIGAMPVPPATISRSRPESGVDAACVPIGGPIRQVSPTRECATIARLTQPLSTARTWNSSDAVVPRRVGGREVAPQPRALRRLDAQVLARPVRDGLAGLHGDHREVPADALVLHHPAQPGRRAALGLGRRAHRFGRPCRTRRSTPSRPRASTRSPENVADGADQRHADRVVVLGEHTELAVVAAELLEERHELVGLVDHLHDVHERAQQAAALHLHVDREQARGSRERG